MDLQPDINLKPRVFIKKDGEDYVEIARVQSFERNDYESKENIVSFKMSGKQDQAVVKMLNANDKIVDVRMEFSLGVTMVMKFSGEVLQFTGDALTILMVTPVDTEVPDGAMKLH